MDPSDPKFKDLLRRAIAEEDERITAETAAVFGIDGVLAEKRRIDVCTRSGDHTVVLQASGEEKRYVIPAALIGVAKRRKKLPIKRRTKLVVEDEFAYLDYEDEDEGENAGASTDAAEHDEPAEATDEIAPEDAGEEWTRTDVVEFPDLSALRNDTTDELSEPDDDSGASLQTASLEAAEILVESGEWSKLDESPDPLADSFSESAEG